MLHYLVPKRANPVLSSREIVKRLRREFKYVAVSRRAAQMSMAESLKWLKGIKRRGWGPCPMSEIDDMIRRTKEKMRLALHVVFADGPNDEDAFLQTLLVPGESLSFGYCSRRNQRASAPLRRRCAKVLGYRITTERPEVE